ncbi:MAG: hypothetical protein ETSY1_24100 [Candidatus Entotheonella factor]|uniref:Radical SAM core domain-containing protein n=1 Tax=Entotheonella factor TaxID=1429438 RepID=W4LH69_ENTF1|nr:MAG: hypothetical protein ETSY1_24100 [Candidatus Entotheonella factor]
MWKIATETHHESRQIALIYTYLAGRLYGHTRFFYTDRLQAIVSHKLPVPIHVFLDTTRECNHRCWYCYEYLGASLGIQRDESVRHFAPIEELTAILEELAIQGVSAIDFCGGEPLLHREP